MRGEGGELMRAQVDVNEPQITRIAQILELETTESQRHRGDTEFVGMEGSVVRAGGMG